MLWVYGQRILFTLSMREVESRRQNLTSMDVRFWRLKSVPALKMLNLRIITGKTSSQQRQSICITFVQCQPNVFDVGLTLYLRRWADIVQMLCKCFVFAGWGMSHNVICPMSRSGRFTKTCELLWSSVADGGLTLHHTHQVTFNIKILVECWAIVTDGDPAFRQHQV